MICFCDFYPKIFWCFFLKHQFWTASTLEKSGTFRAAICSNRCREPIHCHVGWMVVSDWLAPVVAANSCILLWLLISIMIIINEQSSHIYLEIMYVIFFIKLIYMYIYINCIRLLLTSQWVNKPQIICATISCNGIYMHTYTLKIHILTSRWDISVISTNSKEVIHHWRKLKCIFESVACLNTCYM